MRPYADSNFLTRLYLRSEALPLPQEAVAEMMRSGHRLPLFWLHRAEVCNAFELHVFVSKSGGGVRVNPEMAAAAQGRFNEDCQSGSGPLHLLMVEMGQLGERFRDLSQRHTALHGFRTYDILHVAAALIFRCDVFWSYDAKCNRLARLEGLETFGSS